MEFELHGAKFNYEYGNIYQLYEYKTKPHEWKQRKICIGSNGYMMFRFQLNIKKYAFQFHRIVYWLHNPDWDMMDTSSLIML